MAKLPLCWWRPLALPPLHIGRSNSSVRLAVIRIEVNSGPGSRLLFHSPFFPWHTDRSAFNDGWTVYRRLQIQDLTVDANAGALTGTPPSLAVGQRDKQSLGRLLDQQRPNGHPARGPGFIQYPFSFLPGP